MMSPLGKLRGHICYGDSAVHIFCGRLPWGFKADRLLAAAKTGAGGVVNTPFDYDEN